MFLLSVFMNFFDKKKKKNTKDVTSIPFRTKIVQPVKMGTLFVH